MTVSKVADRSSRMRTDDLEQVPSVISPTLFSVMINDKYVNLPAGMGRSLFADVGAIWKRGRHVEHIVKKVQDGTQQVEKWGIKWGFQFSVEKTKVMFNKVK